MQSLKENLRKPKVLLDAVESCRVLKNSRCPFKKVPFFPSKTCFGIIGAVHMVSGTKMPKWTVFACDTNTKDEDGALFGYHTNT